MDACGAPRPGDLLIIGDRFKRYCAIGSGLATARAYKALAKHHHGELQVGWAAQESCRLWGARGQGVQRVQLKECVVCHLALHVW